MSGRQAKAARQVVRRDIAEHALQAHDRLHKDDVDAAHQLLHRALGLPVEGEFEEVATLGHLRKFDAAFVALCQKHSIVASYVAIDPTSRPPVARLISGGAAEIAAKIDGAMREQERRIQAAADELHDAAMAVIDQ